jgi:hypothetical protein
MYPTIQKTVKRLFQSLRDYLKPRTNTEEIWHTRTRHLGPKALKRLVKNTRNIIIQGTSRKKYKYYAVTYATQVISRRPPEKSSPRPFWRVTWDLFDFPEGYNGCNWLLVIKDEYSGKLYSFCLVNKSGAEITRVLMSFESFTKRQYRLSICVFKHNNNTLVIAIHGYTAYKI